MAEIKLICPGCEAQFVLPQNAIPAAGREVECSACGRVWQAQRPDAIRPLDLASFNLPAQSPQPVPVVPPASRRLAPEVLDILREEVEHERRLREAEDQPAQEPDADADWPATTVILPPVDPRPVLPDPEPQLPLATAPRPLLRPAAPAAAHPVPPRPVLQPEQARDNRGSYAAGFALMLLLAASCIALYLLAPALADRGPLGQRLAELREALDSLRLWLDSQAARLRG